MQRSLLLTAAISSLMIAITPVTSSAQADDITLTNMSKQELREIAESDGSFEYVVGFRASHPTGNLKAVQSESLKKIARRAEIRAGSQAKRKGSILFDHIPANIRVEVVCETSCIEREDIVKRGKHTFTVYFSNQ